MSNIVQLPGAPLSPALLLNDTAEQLPEIESLIVIKLFTDGTVECDWSHMSLADLCFAGSSMSAVIAKALANEEE